MNIVSIFIYEIRIIFRFTLSIIYNYITSIIYNYAIIIFNIIIPINKILKSRESKKTLIVERDSNTLPEPLNPNFVLLTIYERLRSLYGMPATSDAPVITFRHVLTHPTGSGLRENL